MKELPFNAHETLDFWTDVGRREDGLSTPHCDSPIIHTFTFMAFPYGCTAHALRATGCRIHCGQELSVRCGIRSVGY